MALRHCVNVRATTLGSYRGVYGQACEFWQDSDSLFIVY